jgi:predicted dehydrogenase
MTSMRLGIFGTDERTAAVAAAAAARGDDLVPERAAPGGWETFLDPAACDAVLVAPAGHDPGRAEAVRTLVQAGRPLLVAQPLELSMLWAWELEMIRRDAGGPLVPVLPERRHPLVLRLQRVIEAALAGSGPLGAVESLVLERRQADRSRVAVLASLARDADLVRVLAGEPGRLSALGAAADADIWNSLTVGFNGPTNLPVRWEVAGGPPGLDLALRCAEGTLVVGIPASWSEPWTWSGPAGPEGPVVFDAAREALAALDEACERGETATAESGGLPPASWADAARAIELAETVPRSLTKGRGIDLHQEEFSELGTFRGTMASLGCGIILAALVLVVLATLVGGIAHEFDWNLGGRLAGAWPAVALTVLGGFLVLQLLPLLVARPRRHE